MENMIIDTDPGVDDAITFLYTFGCNKDLNVTLITSAGGNGPIENITDNAIHLLELFGEEIPVAKGADKPLVRPASYATYAQGKSGLGKYTYNHKKLSHKPLEKKACDAMFEALKNTKGKTTIVSIGPMTNIAKLLQHHPESKKYIKNIIFESGTKEKIYGKPYKSFNVGYDPEAAEVVFQSGVPLIMIPMELGHFAYLDKQDIKNFKQSGKIGKIFAKMFKGYKDFHVGNLGAAVHDVCTVFYLTHPWYFKAEKAHIEVAYYSDTIMQQPTKNHTKNNLQSAADSYGYVNIDFEKTPNALVCMDLDISAFKEELFKALDRINRKLSNKKTSQI